MTFFYWILIFLIIFSFFFFQKKFFSKYLKSGAKQEAKLALRLIKASEQELANQKRASRLLAKEIALENEQKQLITQRQSLILQMEQIHNLSASASKGAFLTLIKEQYWQEGQMLIEKIEKESQAQADKKAQNIIVNAIERNARSVVKHATTYIIKIRNPDLRGKIIGKNGRNIKAIENETGVDLILDDNMEQIQISSFNPLRREIAKRVIKALIADGRIHPGTIEKEVAKVKEDLQLVISQIGREAVAELKIRKIAPGLVHQIGILHFRTSYGQNALLHSQETALIAGALAAQLNLDQQLAKRAGLLHDIGKTLDIEKEGSHVQLGVEIATQYQENEVVINAIECHHGNKEPNSLIAWLVTAADAISAARPGARQNVMQNYLQRVSEIEKIANGFAGVKECYVIKGGRELRVFVA